MRGLRTMTRGATCARMTTALMTTALMTMALVACGDDDGPGTDAGLGSDGSVGGADLSVLLEAEESITEGLDPGTADESILDGWTVRFDKYLVAIGDVDLAFATDETRGAEDGTVWVVDLAQVPATGLPLWSFDGLAAGRWEVFYATPGAGDGAMRHESVSEADFAEMERDDLTYLIEGVITKADGESCPPPDGECSANAEVRFRFGVPAETLFGPCEPEEGVTGVAVPESGTATMALTIHGDHLFFNGFPEGEEGGVMRLAQWLADADLDLDGEVTEEELKSIAPADLAELDGRYELGGSPITPLEDMWDYVIAQLKTQGHFQGEGECPFDGIEHDH